MTRLNKDIVFDHAGREECSVDITLVGCGNMGQALLSAWLDSGVGAARVQVIETAPSEELQEKADRLRFRLCSADAAEPFAILIVAVKPQVFGQVAVQTRYLLDDDTLIISIMAGVSLATLHQAYGADTSVVRSMPNLAAWCVRA